MHQGVTLAIPARSMRAGLPNYFRESFGVAVAERMRHRAVTAARLVRPQSATPKGSLISGCSAVGQRASSGARMSDVRIVPPRPQTHRLAAQDGAFSARRHEFESHWVCQFVQGRLPERPKGIAC